MQSVQSTRKIESNLQTTGKAFSIETNAKAFQILSSNLYQNKPRAIIRELCCNAHDAHVEAGNDDPFHVILPSDLKPELRVRDYGTGMTHDQVTTLYTTYFGSDKRETNELIGGLGLGSKAPFSYTDSFSVESTVDGVRNFYSAQLGDNGIPHIYHIGSQETDDPNGVEIVVPVNPKDFYEFRNEAKEVLKWFSKKPHVVGVDIPNYDRLYENEDYVVFNETTWATRFYVLMGNVCYKVDYDQLPSEFHTRYGESVLSRTSRNLLAIKVDIGDVEVAASRETLSLDKRTLKTIDAKLAKLESRIKHLYAQSFMSAPTLFDAAHLLLNFKFGSLCKPKHLLGGSKAEERFMRIPVSHSVVNNHTWRRKRLTTRSYNSFSLTTTPDEVMFIWVPEGERGQFQINKYLEANRLQLSSYSYLAIVYGDWHKVSRLFHTIGPDRWVYFKELTVPARVPKVQRVTGQSRVTKKDIPSKYQLRTHLVDWLTSHRFKDVRGYWNISAVDLSNVNDHTCWVRLEEGHIADCLPNKAVLNLDGWTVIGIPRHMKKAIEYAETHGIPHVDEVAAIEEKAWEDFKKTKTYEEYVFLNTLAETRIDWSQLYTRQGKKILEEFSDSLLGYTMACLHKYHQLRDEKNMRRVRDLSLENSQEAFGLFEWLDWEYPLVKELADGYYSNNFTSKWNAIKHYIELAQEVQQCS